MPKTKAQRERDRAIREALQRGGYQRFLAFNFRRSILLEQGTRGLWTDAQLVFAREVEGPIIAAVGAVLSGSAGQQIDARSADNADEVAPPDGSAPPKRLTMPRPMPAELTTAIRDVTARGGRLVFQTIDKGTDEIARQEAAFAAKGMVRAYGVESLPDVPLAKIEANAAEPPAGPIVTGPAAEPVERIGQEATKAPVFGKLVEDVFGKSLGGLRDKIEAEIGGMLQRGASVDEIVRRLRGTKALKFTDGLLPSWRAHTIKAYVRTIVTHVSAKAREASFTELGAPFVQLVATLDLRTTPQCLALDLTVWPAGSGPRPPIHVNCRTDVIPWWSEDKPDFGGKRASKDGPVPSTTKAKDWWYELPAEEQNQLVGVTRARALREETLTFDQLFDPNLRLLPIAELRTLGLLPKP